MLPLAVIKRKELLLNKIEMEFDDNGDDDDKDDGKQASIFWF